MIRLRCLTAVVTSVVVPAGSHLVDLSRRAVSSGWQSRPALPRRPGWSPRPDECLYGDWFG